MISRQWSKLSLMPIDEDPQPKYEHFCPIGLPTGGLVHLIGLNIPADRLNCEPSLPPPPPLYPLCFSSSRTAERPYLVLSARRSRQLFECAGYQICLELSEISTARRFRLRGLLANSNPKAGTLVEQEGDRKAPVQWQLEQLTVSGCQQTLCPGHRWCG